MKFYKEPPTNNHGTSGWYWIIDLEYPIPQLVFYSQVHKAYWDWGRETKISEFTHKFIRWGDRLEEPASYDNDIEY